MTATVSASPVQPHSTDGFLLSAAPNTPTELGDLARLAAAKTIFILPCSKSKWPVCRSEDTAAELVYRGTGFLIGSRLLREHGAQWMILSGGYAFLQRDTRIRDYERRIAWPGDDPAWFERAREVARARYPFLWTVPRLVVLGSHQYAAAAETILAGRADRALPLESPVAGLPIGRMNQALARGHWLTVRS